MSNLSEELSRINKMLNEPGDPTDFGCSMEQLDMMIEKCRTIDPNRYYCAVSNWFIWDIAVPEDFEVTSLQLIYANTIIDDEAGRFYAGQWVRSSAVQSNNENCIFSTSNTHYILIGSGTRKSVSAMDVSKLF